MSLVSLGSSFHSLKMIMCVCHLCSSGLKTSPTSSRVAQASMVRLDTLKVFLGQLNADCFKPKIMSYLEWFGLHAEEVYVPEIKTPGALGIAFCTFLTEEEAQHCIACFHGLSDLEFTPSTVQAGRTIMGAFICF